MKEPDGKVVNISPNKIGIMSLKLNSLASITMVRYERMVFVPDSRDHYLRTICPCRKNGHCKFAK